MRPLLQIAVDTSTSRPAVALLKGAECLHDWLGPDALRHHETLLQGVDACLKAAGIVLSEIDFVSVGVGPGMFTGLRIGITTAKFLADPLNIPCVPVSSLVALAYQSQQLEHSTVWALSDARSQRVYALKLAPSHISPDFSPVPGEEVAEPPADVFPRIQAGDFVIGEGAMLYENQLPAGVKRPSDSEQNWLRGSSIGAVGHLRYQLGLTCSAVELEPTYLKTGQPHL
jgi:tRNA threonylcarbamoyladenosine biosynthesis protein TsaB